ncbi:NnrS family protein [Rhodocyclus tenuis]|uniref:NnrS family protein n=1 Tax=Rhodocyclus tenuis TaxID=1066 RepID=UPI001902DA83|nr:NnrS family protein [Rhodocyclus tenuis]MBK1679668.1 short-chain dehydrogenase [Rhodocyclus tenuis]
MAFISIDELTAKRIPPETFSLFALGFRPFFLLAALFGALAVPVWALVLAGVVSTPLPGLWWHAHEMIFGFAAAVIVGFLFTAGKAWTGQQTPTGQLLAALAALWIAGRLAMALGDGVWVALVDAAFLPVCAAIFVGLLVRSRNKVNYFIGGLLSVLGLLNLGFHLARLHVLAVDPLSVLHFALCLIVLLETIIAGRVVPMFTLSAIRGVRQWRNKTFDYAAIACTGLALALWAGEAGAWAAAVAVVAALLQTARTVGWNTWATRKNPLLWVLHVSHLWIPLGLLLLAAAQWQLLPRSAGIHALAIGATGGLIIGMITRTALGHTGRWLVAGPVETIAYALVHLAALTRVLTIAAIPAAASGGVHLAATLWALAFLLYFWRYRPFLTRARLDGKPG